MNVRMWLHKTTQINSKTLQDFGYLFIGPEKVKWRVVNMVGKMSSPKQIFSYLENYFKKEIQLRRA